MSQHVAVPICRSVGLPSDNDERSTALPSSRASSISGSVLKYNTPDRRVTFPHVRKLHHVTSANESSETVSMSILECKLLPLSAAKA